MVQANNEFLMYRVLHQKYQFTPAVEALASQDPDKLELKQMCAKVPPDLIRRVDEVTAFLDVSKRKFIESAVANAVQESENLISEILEPLMQEAEQ